MNKPVELYNGRIVLYHVDARDVLPIVGKVDAVITDPPYGMNADTFNSSNGRTGAHGGSHGYSDNIDTFHQCAAALFTHAARVTRAQAHLYCFCDIDQ